MKTSQSPSCAFPIEIPILPAPGPEVCRTRPARIAHAQWHTRCNPPSFGPARARGRKLLTRRMGRRTPLPLRGYLRVNRPVLVLLLFQTLSSSLSRGFWLFFFFLLLLFTFPLTQPTGRYNTLTMACIGAGEMHSLFTYGATRQHAVGRKHIFWPSPTCSWRI